MIGGQQVRGEPAGQPNETTPSTTPKTSALRVGTGRLTSGRALVRFITASMSASTTQLSAFALPAASVPPTSVASTSQRRRDAALASNIAGTVVTSSCSIIRGFVSAT